MQNESSLNVRTGKLPLRTFIIFGITLLMTIGATWWTTRSIYKDTEINDKAFLLLDSSLKSANYFLQSDIRILSAQIAQKLRDPATVQTTRYWKPKADSVIFLTDNLYNHIENFRQHTFNIKNSKGRNYSSCNEKSLEMYSLVKDYAMSIMSLIPLKNRNQISSLPVNSFLIDSGYWRSRSANSYLNNLTTKAESALLSKLQFDVLSSANLMVNYINAQTERIIYYDEFLLPFVTQNTTVLSPNQTLEITAGIGAYTSITKPKITINNLEQQLNEEGIAVYKQKIISKRGGSIPLTISFKDPNTGETKTLWKNINYTVFDPLKK